MFGEGIHGGILTRLADIADLRVIARTSVRQYRNSEKPTSRIADELGVEWVLEGQVLESAPDFRTDVRLVEAASDRQVWARSYVETLTARNVFDVQAEITKKIVGALEAELTRDEEVRVERRPTEHLEAYRLSVQARDDLDQRTEADMLRAVAGFERALELDPDYALAWVGLADGLGLLAAYGYVDSETVLPRAEAAIRRALGADPASAEAHAALGRFLGAQGDAMGADRALKRAIEMKPGYAEAHNWHTVGMLVLGRPDAAVASGRRAVALNPLSPEVVINLGFASLFVGEPEQALTESRRVRELVPGYESGEFLEGLILYETKRFEEAASILRDLSIPWAGEGPRAVRALALTALEALEEAGRLLAEIVEEGDRFAAGLVQAALGATEEAFDEFLALDFDHGETRRGYWPTLAMRYLFRDVWDCVRHDPRFDELWRRMHASAGLDATTA